MEMGRRSFAAVRAADYRRWLRETQREDAGEQRRIFYAAYEIGFYRRQPLVKALLAERADLRHRRGRP